MPIGFLTATERDRLNHFPIPIPDEDLRAFFWLSEDDKHVINRQREAHTRLGFALQLCALRYLGFAPDDLSTTPEEVVRYVAGQLDVPVVALHAYGQRVKTRTTHFQQVQAYLGFRTATPRDVAALQTWLQERALEHDKPSVLLQLACDKLRREQIVRPGLTRLERLVATARHAAHIETFRRLTPLLTPARATLLDDLLMPDPQTGRTVLNWLRREATAASAPQLGETLTKVCALLDMGIATWDPDFSDTCYQRTFMCISGRYPMKVLHTQWVLNIHIQHCRGGRACPLASRYASASSNTLASCRAAVSKPSVNQPYTGARSCRASTCLPCCCHRRARLMAARSSRDFASWWRAIARAS